ncbi:hypothetical protein EON68_01605, partial [archaeon]
MDLQCATTPTGDDGKQQRGSTQRLGGAELGASKSRAAVAGQRSQPQGGGGMHVSASTNSMLGGAHHGLGASASAANMLQYTAWQAQSGVSSTSALALSPPHMGIDMSAIMSPPHSNRRGRSGEASMMHAQMNSVGGSFLAEDMMATPRSPQSHRSRASLGVRSALDHLSVDGPGGPPSIRRGISSSSVGAQERTAGGIDPGVRHFSDSGVPADSTRNRSRSFSGTRRSLESTNKALSMLKKIGGRHRKSSSRVAATASMGSAVGDDDAGVSANMRTVVTSDEQHDTVAQLAIRKKLSMRSAVSHSHTSVPTSAAGASEFEASAPPYVLTSAPARHSASPRDAAPPRSGGTNPPATQRGAVGNLSGDREGSASLGNMAATPGTPQEHPARLSLRASMSKLGSFARRDHSGALTKQSTPLQTSRSAVPAASVQRYTQAAREAWENPDEQAALRRRRRRRSQQQAIEALIVVAGQMQHALNRINAEQGTDVRMRTGVHCGWVVTAMVGQVRPRFHIFGPDVLQAEEMEHTGEKGRIHVSARVRRVLESSAFQFSDRGEVSAE